MEKSGPDRVYRFSRSALESALTLNSRLRRTWCRASPALRAERPQLHLHACPAWVRKPHGHAAVTWGRQRNSTRIPPPAFRSMRSRASKCPQRASARQSRPSPQQPVPLTWGPAALPEASGTCHPRRAGVCIRKGARSATRRPQALRDPVRAAWRVGRTGGARPAHAASCRTRASAPITALSVGRGLRALARAASACSEGPRGLPWAAGAPGPEQRERASASEERERGGRRRSRRAPGVRSGAGDCGPRWSPAVSA